MVKEVWQAVYIEKFSHAQAAARFSISKTLVGKLIRQIKTEPTFVEELRAKELAAETKFQTTVAVIGREMEHGIWTTAQVAKTV